MGLEKMIVENNEAGRMLWFPYIKVKGKTRNGRIIETFVF